MGLDELPQILNILVGEMSFVGPRSLAVGEILEDNNGTRIDYEDIPGFNERLQTQPGLTGLAQISGRGELTREEKLELDVEYVETASFAADIKIILTTIARVFRRKSIYEKRYSQTEETRGEKK